MKENKMENELLIISVYGPTSVVITAFIFTIRKPFLSIQAGFSNFAILTIYIMERAGDSMTSSWS